MTDVQTPERARLLANWDFWWLTAALLNIPNTVGAGLAKLGPYFLVANRRPGWRVSGLLAFVALLAFITSGFLRFSAEPSLLWVLLSISSFIYFVALCGNRAWAANEYERRLITQGGSDESPDNLPDLLGIAVLGAFAMVILFPSLLFFANSASCTSTTMGCLFVGSTMSRAAWMTFGFDVFLRAINFSIVQEVFAIPPFTNIQPTGPLGHILLLILRGSVGVIAVATLFDVIAIQGNIRAALAKLSVSPAPAIAVGSRALPGLLAELRSQSAPASEQDTHAEDAKLTVKNIIAAIAGIGDDRSLFALKQIVEQRRVQGQSPRPVVDEFVRRRAVKAMQGVVDRLPVRSCRPRLFGPWWTIFWLRLWCKAQVRVERSYREGRKLDVESGIVYDALSNLAADLAPQRG